MLDLNPDHFIVETRYLPLFIVSRPGNGKNGINRSLTYDLFYVWSGEGTLCT